MVWTFKESFWGTVMNRAGKIATVQALKEVFGQAGVVVVTHYAGLNVADMTALRSMLGEGGGALKVVKNRLAKLALDGTGGSDASDLFRGPVAIAYSSDPVSAAKAVWNFAKDNENLVVIGAIMGDTTLDAEGVTSLAKLPSLDELRGKIIGVIQAPATKVAGVIQAPAGQLARIMNAYAEKEAA